MRRVTVRIPDDVYEEMREIQRQVRVVGHYPPTFSTLVGALIHNAVNTSWGGGEQSIEEDVIAPYRIRFDEVT